VGGHLTKRLKASGYWVRGVDLKHHEYGPSAADEFLILDLREHAACVAALTTDGGVDEVYQLAADMGGMGFIHVAECEIMRNNALINLNMIDAATTLGVRRYFLSSSVCVYRDMERGEPKMAEAGAYPALPHNEYGWEKLYAERAVQAYGRRYDIVVRIARFENCYGPYGTWVGGREKAPAAICRKVAEARDGGTIEVWGDGHAVRNYTFVDDMVEGIYLLMQSDLEGPVNIGNDEYVSVSDLVDVVASIAGKEIQIRYTEGPVGVQSRNFSHERIHSLGWEAEYSLDRGIAHTFPWIEHQVRCVSGHSIDAVNGTNSVRNGLTRASR
jgi:nucleoside-diphosphate-sugar epimerase